MVPSIASPSASPAPNASPSPTAVAPTITPAETPEAIVGQGVQARLAGDDRRALALFERAFALTPTPRIRTQIGFAHQALGNWVEAGESLLAALETPDDPWIQRNRSTIDQALATIGEHISALQLEIDVTGAAVTLDGARHFTTPITHRIVVPLGTVVVEVEAPGYVPVRRVVVTSGPSAREMIRLVRIVATNGIGAGSASGPIEPISRARLAAPYIVAGIGGLGFLASGVMLGVRNSLAAGCVILGDELICPSASARADAQTSMQVNVAMNVTTVAATLLAVGGITWWIVDRFTLPAARATTREHASRVRWTPVFSGPAFVGVAGRF